MTAQNVVRAAAMPARSASATRGTALVSRYSASPAVALAAVAALVSFAVGFLRGENSSGGASFDFARFHWPCIELFSSLPWSRAVLDYPSATNPLIYMLGSLLPWGPLGFRIFTTLLSVGTATLLAVACHRRACDDTLPSEMPANGKPERSNLGWLWCAFAGSLILLSPAFRATSFWGNTDPFPLFFTVCTSLLLSSFSKPAQRSKQSQFCIAASVALLSCSAFYTRQFYAFLPLVSAWALLTRTRLNPAIVLGVFATMALPEIVLITIWHGLNPPTFHNQASPSSSDLLFMGANVGLFALPLLAGLMKNSPADILPAWWNRTATIVCLAGLVIFNIALLDVAWPDAGGGLLVKAGMKLGSLGKVIALSGAYLGLLTAILTAIRSATNALLVSSFLLPFLIVYPVYERYFDPVIFIGLLLFAAPETSRKLLTGRVVTCYFVFSVALLLISQIHFATNL